MNKRVTVLLTVGLMSLSSLTIAVATPCACGPEIIIPPTPTTNGGGFAFASFGNGEFFSWDTYVPPIVKLTQNGTTTSIATTAGYFRNTSGGQVAGVTKFKFTKDMGVNSSIQPDLNELVKVLIAENYLPATTTKIVYDMEVRAAVSKFQVNHGIHHGAGYTYGYFGPKTRAFQNSR